MSEETSDPKAPRPPLQWWRSVSLADQLKRDADLVGMIRSHGVDLKPQGSDLLALCPFHEEKTPSFRVSPSKNLWRCFGCGKGGSAVDWITAVSGCSLREAFDQLRVQQGMVDPTLSKPREWVDTEFSPDPDWDEGRMLREVASHYARRLASSALAQDYLRRRGLWDEGLVRRFQLGFAERTLGLSIGKTANRRNTQLRESLASLGLMRESGHEHFSGCLVVPILGEPDGDGIRPIQGMYGRRVNRPSRANQVAHLYLKGAHRGVFNAEGVRASGADTVILCESILDALTFIRWGWDSVTCAYGVHGVTPELWQFLTTSGFRRVVIAFDGDDAGNNAATELGPRLHAEGLEVQRLRLLMGQDVNELAVGSVDPVAALQQALDGASWMGGELYPDRPIRFGRRDQGTDVDPISAPPPPSLLAAPSSAAAPSVAPAVEVASPDALQVQAPPSEAPEPSNQADSRRFTPERDDSRQAAPGPALEGDTGTVEASFGDRCWRVKGLFRNRADDVLRVTVRVLRTGGSAFHLDTLDLYQAKARETFARTAAAELAVEIEVVRADLARLVVRLEESQKAALQAASQPPTPERVVLTAEQRDEALSLLKRPDMLRQLLSDLEASGMVGEEENKLLCWLSLSSRRLESPLGVLIQSSSAAGKSSLLDGVLRTMPEEEVVRYSALSGQALFYMGGVSLKHKILCVAEEEGARRASYSLKLLQSDGELSMASTGKDPESGQLVTKEYRTEGPVALALTTTSLAVDPELQNRCLVLSVDESREQTEAIHRLQRASRTRQGQTLRRDLSQRLAVWRNAQRLLEPVDVVNPFAESLTFASHRTRTRRDMAKYLTLVEVVAFVHQHQKVKHFDACGCYIEVGLDDIELANRLAVRGLGIGLRELSGPSDRLLRTLRAWVRGQAQKQGIEPGQVRFTRRDLSDCTPWSSTQLKEHLRTLVEQEVLSMVRGKAGVTGSVHYQLEGLDGEDGSPSSVGLLDVERLRGLHPQAPYGGTWAYDAGRPGEDEGRPEVGRDPAGCENRPTSAVIASAPEARQNGGLQALEATANGPQMGSVGPVVNSHKEVEENRRVVVSYSPGSAAGVGLASGQVAA